MSIPVVNLVCARRQKGHCTRLSSLRRYDRIVVAILALVAADLARLDVAHADTWQCPTSVRVVGTAPNWTVTLPTGWQEPSPLNRTSAAGYSFNGDMPSLGVGQTVGPGSGYLNCRYGIYEAGIWKFHTVIYPTAYYPTIPTLPSCPFGKIRYYALTETDALNLCSYSGCNNANGDNAPSPFGQWSPNDTLYKTFAVCLDAAPYPSICAVQNTQLVRSGSSYTAYGECAAAPPPPSNCGAQPSVCITPWDANCCCTDASGTSLCI